MNIGNDYLNVVIERKKIKNIYFRINEKNEIYENNCNVIWTFN